jgi:hypothetical protein
MFRLTIVIWLVLLVLALTVVAFISRLVEKYRLADRFSRVRGKPVSVTQSSAPGLEAPIDRPTQRYVSSPLDKKDHSNAS